MCTGIVQRPFVITIELWLVDGRLGGKKQLPALMVTCRAYNVQRPYAVGAWSID